MTLGATVQALDALAFLPQTMCVVTFAGFGVALINAAAVEEGLEAVFVNPFVDGQATFCALEVTSSLLVCVLISRLRVLLLDSQQLLDGTGPGEFLSNCLVGA